MRNTQITTTIRRLAAGCSFALLIAVGGGTALAHGGHNGGDHVSNGDHFGNGDHVGNGGHGRCIGCGGKWSNSRDWNGSGKRHHHHHATMASSPPLHGPGSSHNPIVHHPVHGPGSSHNPIIAPVTVVRDHRTPPRRPPRPNPRCNKHNITGCEVRDHRTPPAPQCLGDLC